MPTSYQTVPNEHIEEANGARASQSGPEFHAPKLIRVASFSADRKRWPTLIIFSAGSLISAMIFLTFSAISSESALFYGVSSTAINALAITFMCTFLPGSLLSSYLVGQHELRSAMLVGAVLNTIGAWLRYISVFGHDAWWGYPLLFLGQLTVALVGPIYGNTPATVATEWFPVEEREMATTVGSLVQPLGNAMAAVIPTLLVTQNTSKDKDQHLGGFATLLMSQAIFCTLQGLCTYAYFDAKPVEPPSTAASARRLPGTGGAAASPLIGGVLSPAPSRDGQGMALYNAAGTSTPQLNTGRTVKSFFRSWWADVKTLFSHPQYRLLFGGFSIGLAVFNGLLTVIEQIVTPCGYTSSDAGVFGGVLIGFGTVNAGIVSVFLDKTHAYVKTLKTLFAVAIIGIVFFASQLKPDNYYPLFIAFSFLGLSVMPLLPVNFSLAAEIGYPIAEDTCLCILSMGGMYMAAVVVFLFDYLIKLRPHYKNIYTPASIFLLSSMLVAGVFVAQFKGDFNRLKQDLAHKEQEKQERSRSAAAAAAEV